ncbi:MAG TPA: DUF4136 domain-containing protein [Candidatus Sulfotelmatobacter sp.]|nr:DUF4136 domain-containing protein [Candidatus Sulfotelmatobacter sp.]
MSLTRFPFRAARCPRITAPGTIAVLLLFSLTVFVPQLAAQKVRVQYDKTTDFSKYKTYAWVPGTPVFDPKLDAYIEDRVLDALRRSGLSEAPVNSAELLVTYHAAINTDLSVGTAIDPTYAASGGVATPGSSIWEAGGGGTTHVTKGSLIFEIVSRLTNRPIWTGTAKHTVSDQHAERWNQVKKALDKIFQEFPPQSRANNRG